MSKPITLKYSNTSKNYAEWRTLYEQIFEIFKIPSISKEFASNAQQWLMRLASAVIIKCDLVVKLGEVFARASKTRARIFRIYADVIQVDDDLDISTVDGGGMIFMVARRIEVKEGCKVTINCGTKDPFRVMVYAMEIPCELCIIAKDSGLQNEHHFALNRPNLGGLLTLSNDGKHEFQDLPKFDETIFRKTSFSQMIQFSLHIGISMLYDEPEITRSILLWIIKITDDSEIKIAKELHTQGLAMLVQLEISLGIAKNETLFIPQLNCEEYEKIIESFLKSALNYEREYDNYIRRTEEQVSAQNMLNYYNMVVKGNKDLESRAQIREVAAYKVLECMEKNLESQKKLLEEASNRFKEGVDEWLSEKENEAKRMMALAVVIFATSVGEFLIQPHNAVCGLAETIKRGVESYNCTKEAYDKAMETTQKIEEIYRSLEEIEKISANLRRHHDLAKRCEGVNGSFDVDSLGKDIESVDHRGILARNRWSSFIIGMRSVLHDPIEERIDGAEDYLCTLEKSYNCIVGYIDAKIEVIASHEKLMRLKFQTELTRRRKEIEEENESKKLTQEMDSRNLLSLFERLLSIKGWMLIYIQNYNYAYNYWSLDNFKVNLSTTKTTTQYREDVNQIKQKIIDAKNRFRKDPQTLNHAMKFSEKNYVDEFKQNGSIVIEFPLDYDKFKNFGYMRLVRFGAFLEGVGSEGQEISLRISNTGKFSDKYGKDEYHFISEPIKGKRFIYRVPGPSGCPEVIMDNTYDSKTYFLPTPFSQWTIEVTEPLDLSRLTSIKIELTIKCHENHVH
ncbi:15920_t:CDS:2 [Acaulospora morrowiae]|uniref:15920_t:CDS:1 n=1 Tax=Acaulospora morrowiae TaxID=94023 RepID=A0A9N8V6U9_9GLOM|nr:15920_t:CDS:2 [Acaulospora morrowiae]